VRRAFAHAIDRDALPHDLDPGQHGRACTGGSAALATASLLATAIALAPCPVMRATPPGRALDEIDLAHFIVQEETACGGLRKKLARAVTQPDGAERDHRASACTYTAEPRLVPLNNARVRAWKTAAPSGLAIRLSRQPGASRVDDIER
jgi:hypothetical protein